ncbi:MAG: hypothetical protein ACFFD2_02765 [Promethearchaeota archaeon]
MGRIDAVLNDELEKKFRAAVATRYGGMKGRLSKAIKEAIDEWLSKKTIKTGGRVLSLYNITKRDWIASMDKFKHYFFSKSHIKKWINLIETSPRVFPNVLINMRDEKDLQKEYLKTVLQLEQQEILDIFLCVVLLGIWRLGYDVVLTYLKSNLE